MFQMRKLIYVYCCFFILIFISTSLFALSSDSTQPMHIVADSSSFNYHTGVSQYDGHVEVTQGSTKLNADRVITYNNAQHKIQEAIAYGFNQPAEYWTQLKEKDSLLLHAIAAVMHFYPQKSLITLKGNAKVTHGDNTFVGPIAIYDMKKQTVTAPPSKLGRASIVINPDQK